MDLIFSKKNIKNLKLSEGKEYKIFKKSELRLNEDVEDTSYANDMDDLHDAMDDSSTKDAVISKTSTDNNPATSTPTIDVSAKNVTDAQNQIRQNNNNPTMKKLGDNVNYHVHLESLRRNSVPFSKKELNEILKK